MSLRVLLADESSTIKRVMQLALQDFGIEVKAVPVGLDVLQVAIAFRPDIVFADVLLAKKNGYEVSAELKAHPDLKHVPVVLMWSGFMELDEQKAKFSKADRRLEKPFDAETLRQMVKDLVPVVQDNAIANYLSFPNLPPILEDKSAAGAGEKSPVAPIPPSVVEFGADDDEAEDFQQVQLQPSAEKACAEKPAANAGAGKSEDWTHQDLSKFKIDLPKDAFAIDEADLTHTSIALSSGVEEIDLADLEEIETPKKPSTKPSAMTASSPAMSTPSAPKAPSAASTQLSANLASLDPMHVEEILRQEVRAVLEQIAWKIIPDVAERVVREELQKLLKDAERL